MAAAVVQLPTDAGNAGKKVDLCELTVGADTVERQVVAIGDPTGATSLAAVKAASTAAALVDPALAVSLTPNSAIVTAKIRDLVATPVAVKASAGTLFGIGCVNNTAATCFIQVFNVAAGGVTPGTTTPDLEFQVAANSTGKADIPDMGISFGTAITVISTTLEAGSVASASGVQLFPYAV